MKQQSLSTEDKTDSYQWTIERDQIHLKTKDLLDNIKSMQLIVTSLKEAKACQKMNKIIHSLVSPIRYIFL